MLCRVKNPNSILVSSSTRTKHIKQERELSWWSNTQSTSTAVSTNNQDVFGTAENSDNDNFNYHREEVTGQDDMESESISAALMITSSEQYLIADQELFDLESVEEGENREGEEEEDEHEEENEDEEKDEDEDENEDEDEADDIYEEEEDMIEAEDLGKYSYDLTLMYALLMDIFFILELEISEDLIKGLQLFHIKEKHNLTETAFNDILCEIDLFGVSLYRLRKVLKQLVPLEPILVDCCIDSCIAFTKEYETLKYCPICEKSRYKTGSRIA